MSIQTASTHLEGSDEAGSGGSPATRRADGKADGPVRYTLGDIVRRDLVTVAECATLGDAAGLLREKLVSGLVVVDDKAEIVGMVAVSDLVGQPDAAYVTTVMTPLVFSLDASVPVPVAARLMTDSRLHRIFVAENNQTVGLVTLTDIARLVGRVGLGGGASAATPTVQNSDREAAGSSDAGVGGGGGGADSRGGAVDGAGGARLSEMIQVDKPRELFLASLDRCGDRLPSVFYKRFINSSVAISTRFAKTDMATQEAKIARTLRVAADAVTDNREALAELTQQAERHSRRGLNVSPSLYRFWLEALIQAVGECDPQFGQVVEQTWRLLMGNVIRHMVSRY